MIYFVILLYTLFLIIKYDVKGNSVGFQKHYYILLVLSICVAGFSYRLGMDSIGYERYFNLYIDTDLSYVVKHLTEYRYEPIYVLLNTIVKRLFNEYYALQIAVAIFVNTTIFWFLKKHSPVFFFSILLYFLFQYWNFNFEIKRESIAVSLFLIAISNLLSSDTINWKNYVRYYLWCIPIFFAHRFGIMAIIYPLLLNVRLDRKTILAYIFFSLIVVILGTTVLGGIFTLISSYLSYFVQEAVSGYLNKGVYGESVITIIGFITGILFPFVLINRAKTEINPKILSLAIIFLFVKVIQTQIFIVYRLCNYLDFFVYLCYAQCFASEFCKRKEEFYVKGKNQLCKLILIFVLFIQVYNKSHKQQYIRYYPYSSIFTEEINIDREKEYDRLDSQFN